MSERFRLDDLHDWADVQERNVLVLNYTMACPLSCDFCCYGCHPKRTEKMPLSLAKDLISQAAELRHDFSSVAFTGGEVFLHEDELLQLADLLRDVGMPFTVATAAHWGVSAHHADQLATYLVRRGLRRANISCDTAHQQYVDVDAVVNAARAFARHNIPVYVVGTFPGEQALETFVPALVGVKNVALLTKRIAKVGRAKKRKDLAPVHIAKEALTCYRRIFHDLVVFWDGKTYPCCSTFNRSTQGLCIGNANETGLADLLSAADNSLLFKILKRRGFSRLYDIAKERSPALHAALPDLAQFDGACSLCNAIFSNEKVATALQDLIAEYEADQIVSAISSLEELFGKEKVAALFQT